MAALRPWAAAFTSWAAAAEDAAGCACAKRLATDAIHSLEWRERCFRELRRARTDSLAANAIPKYEQNYRQASEESTTSMCRLLDAGLRRRVGRWLNLEDLRIFLAIWSLGGRFLPGTVVCQSCGRVFEPQRKASATRCPVCAHNPKANGSSIPTFDPETGAHSGWNAFHFRECRGCGRTFAAKRADASACSSTCRTRGARGSAPPNAPDGYWPWLRGVIGVELAGMIVRWQRPEFDASANLIREANGLPPRPLR